MEDNLIPYVEFLGLPGCGKSYFSHKVADALRGEGYKIIEPSWELDHIYGRWGRAMKKSIMALLFTLKCPKIAKEIKRIIRNCGISRLDGSRFERNILYKAYLLTQRRKVILFFDEGLSQAAVSLSINGGKPTLQIYEELIAALSLPQKSLLIRIVCDIDTVLLNMNMRTSQDSQVEQFDNVEKKKDYLLQYKKNCESIVLPRVFDIMIDRNDSIVVNQIVNFLRQEVAW